MSQQHKHTSRRAGSAGMTVQLADSEAVECSLCGRTSAQVVYLITGDGTIAGSTMHCPHCQTRHDHARYRWHGHRQGSGRTGGS